MFSKIKELRKKLHKNPELSGHEINTAKRIRDFIQTHGCTNIIENIGGDGLAAIYSYPEKGPTIMIRCELDALLIAEENTFDHRSINKGVSHKCGHDGHMAIVAGLIFWLKQQSFKSGEVILLFQPAEETGEGAYKMSADESFKSLKPDYIFALHNIPGEPLHTIITAKHNFSATVQSLAIYLKGKESHAAEPENGSNPTLAISEIISEFNHLNISNPQSETFRILTPIHMSMGQKSYGVSSGTGELHYTLRTWSEDAMQKLKAELNKIVTHIAKDHGLKYTLEWFEYFPAIINDNTCNEFITNAAKANGFEHIENPYLFKFGEDFGWFSQNYKAAMFGLGAGVDTPALHHADYDFPDEIIETGIKMFTTIIKQIMCESNEYT